ncbi:MAG: hypothetical protein JSU63_15985 [Phycisphaerales bacterium]|nr:MAG: hypothetical protein JSU63_15985 [Phycisphaerales bacterium]
MLPWVECPSLELDLSLPVCERYSSIPPEACAKGKRLLRAVLTEVPSVMHFLADVVRARTRNRFHSEAQAIAHFIGGDWRGVMLANILYDLAIYRYGCSTAVLPTRNGPVIARNMDWPPEDVIAQTSYLIRTHRGGEFVFASAGWPGSLGVVTGLSGRGFAIVLNATSCPKRLGLTGYPVLLHIRRVLEDADSFDSAVMQLSETRLAAPCLITVAGEENHQRVVIERTPRRSAPRWAEEDQPLFVTNHYRIMFQGESSSIPGLDETTCSRYDAISELLGRHLPEETADDAKLLYALTDPSVIQDITAQHVIIHPRQREIRLWVPRQLVDASDARG